MYSYFLISATVALLLSLTAVNAGPGANVFACLDTQHSSPPLTFPLDIIFGPQDSECMNSKGHHHTVTATEPGLTCTEIGYVEAKKSGMCFFKPSIYSLAYATSNITSGKAMTKWYSETRNIDHNGDSVSGKMNVMEFVRGSDDDVTACPSADVCGDAYGGKKGFAWYAGTQEPVYVIFRA